MLVFWWLMLYSQLCFDLFLESMNTAVHLLQLPPFPKRFSIYMKWSDEGNGKNVLFYLLVLE